MVLSMRLPGHRLMAGGLTLTTLALVLLATAQSVPQLAFGMTLAPGQGGVLGALTAAILATYVEKWCRTWVPETLDVLVTPTLTVLLSGLVTLYGLMYAAGETSSAIGTAADWLLSTTGPS